MLCLGLLWYTWPNINIVHSYSCFDTQFRMFRTSQRTGKKKRDEREARGAGGGEASEAS